MKQPDLNFQEVEELLPGYVLGSLEAEEMLAIDDYLGAQTDLKQKLFELEETMVALAMSTPDVPLAPAIKTGFLAQVQADLGQNTVVSAPKAAATVVQPKRVAERGTFAEWLRNLFGSPAPYAVAAVGAFALVLVFGLYALNLSNNLDGAQAALADAEDVQADLAIENQELASELTVARSENAQLATDLSAVESQNISLQNQLMSLQDEYQQVQFNQQQLEVVSYATHSVSMQAHETYPEIRGFFYFGSQQQPGLLVLHGLEKLPDDQIYQFWLVTPDGTQVPHELLSVDGPQAPTVKTIGLDESTPEFVAIGITIEPAGGSEEPSGIMLLQGDDVLEG